MSSEQTDHSLQIRIQLQRLRNGCRQFIQSGDRGIYLNEKYICQIIALARTMGTELRDIELRKKYALKYYHWIKETFEDGFVSEALNIKGVCPAIKAEIEMAINHLSKALPTTTDNTLASGHVLAKLLVLVAPKTEGIPGVNEWLSTLGEDADKAKSVYTKARKIMNSQHNQQGTYMTASVEHLEKLKQLITNVHTQFKKHLPKIDSYLETALTRRKPTFNKKSKNSQGDSPR